MREKKSQLEFVSILSSDGTFRLQVPEGTEGSETREYETSSGEKGIKHEIVFEAISGKVTGVSFATATFGTLLQITVLDDEGELTISTGTHGSFGIDLLKKLPQIKVDTNYRFAPFSFEGDNKKIIRGVSVTEDSNKDKKIKNFFWDEKKEVAIGEFPSPKGDTKKFTKNKWKSYFGEVEDFLIEYTNKNIVPKFGPPAVKEGIDAFDDEINADDIDI